MSRLTKFLRQKCIFESAIRDSSGKTALSSYGDIQYNQPVQLNCRCERFSRDMQTANGSIVKVESRYFLDDSTEVRVDDRLDGHVVLSCSSYIDQFGQCVGYEAYV